MALTDTAAPAAATQDGEGAGDLDRESRFTAYREYRFLVLSDLYRIAGGIGMTDLVRQLLIGEESFQYNFWMRTCRYAEKQPALKWWLYWIARLMLRRLKYRMGISIPFRAKIGSGFYIGHFGGIIVNQDAVIGKNCNISSGVIIGQANRGAYKGCPVLGDNVYIGPGAKIFGAVRIGDNAAIGANCVVTRDVPDNAVVAGVPGRVISNRGSTGYVNNTDYDDKLGRRTA